LAIGGSSNVEFSNGTSQKENHLKYNQSECQKVLDL
jgi:hypothetical protein